MKEKVYFARWPKSIVDTARLHLLSDEKEYKIVGEVVITPPEYVSLALEMRGKWSFLLGYDEQCGEIPIVRCLYVHGEGIEDGLFIVPKRGSVYLAATYTASRDGKIESICQ